ncbi:MAG: hypothetical protein HKN28_00690 [Alphaproteobacteria bacterium]|nr:hypothetical protein [Alphaproteobacteria bacterium]
MLKIALVSIIGLAVLAWFVGGPGLAVATVPPPTIHADLSPIKHRPEGYVAGLEVPRATQVSSRQEDQDGPQVDTLLRLSR